MARRMEKVLPAVIFLPNEWRKCQDMQSSTSMKWDTESMTWRVAESEAEGDDDPLFKPLSVKHVQVKKATTPVRSCDFIGPKSETRRDDGKTDIILKLEEETYEAHKHVLREASELFEKDPSFQHLATDSDTEPEAKRLKIIPEVDLSSVLPEDSKKFDALNKVINFAYTGRLPLATDVGFKHFFFTAVALQFNKALEVYDLYFMTLFKTKERMLSPAAAAIILSQCQKIRKPRPLSVCAEHLGNISESATKYLLKEPLEKLCDDAGFLAYMSAEALVALLDRDDLANVEEEVKVLDLAMKWLKFDHEDVDVENRHKYTKKVLKKVHLGLVSQSRLMALLSELDEVPECAAWVEEVLKLQDGKSDVTVPLSMSHPHWFSPRNKMVVNTLIGIGPYAKSGGQRLVYFNSYGPKKSLGWQHWCGFKDIPHDIPVYDSSVVSIDGKLYVAGGICKPGRREYRFLPAPRYVYKWNSWCFHEGNVAEDPMRFGEDQEFATVDITNPWTTLPELKTVRNSFPMVHLDGYFYIIGGEDEDYNAINQVERYSFRDKKWEKLADLPVPCYYACAAVYKGNILVYGSQPVPDSNTPAQHDLQMYDPATNQWTNLLTEHHKIEKFKKIITKEENAGYIKPRRDMDDKEYDSEAQTTDMLDDVKNKETGRLLPRNALVVDGEDCFRVVYPALESSMKRPPPVVHKLEFGYQGDVPECYVGERLDQSLMPTTGEGAFQIRKRVYINMRGAVFDTNIKISSDQKMEVDLSVWKKLLAEDYLGDLTFTNLTFDKKKVFCKSCIRGKHCANHFSIFDDADVLMKMAESDEDSD